MNRALGILSLGLLLQLGCASAGGEPDGLPAELLGYEPHASEPLAPAPGWKVMPAEFASAHPLENGMRESIKIEAPPLTRKFRIHFRWLALQPERDFLIIKDAWGAEMQRLTGVHYDFESRTIAGSSAELILETDERFPSWGYRIDELRYRDCESNRPGSEQPLTITNCEELGEAIADVATRQIRRRFTSMAGWGMHPLTRHRKALGAADGALAEVAPEHSETNLQVAGVDEADIVKTDGHFMYVLSGRFLRVFRVWPAEATALVAEVEIEGRPKELFLHDGRVMVFSGVHANGAPELGHDQSAVRLMSLRWTPESHTKVTIFSVDNDTLVPESTFLLAGRYNTSRRTNNVVRLVLRRHLRWPDIRYYPSQEEIAGQELDRVVDALEAEAIRLVQSRDLSEWITPSYSVDTMGRQELPTRCENYLVASDATSTNLIGVVTLALGAPGEAVSMLGELVLMTADGLVYQGPENLYVASPHRWACYEDAEREGQYTHLHKIAVPGERAARYAALGGVIGSFNDQFAMDEYDGHLRVASTNNRWRGEDPRERMQNRVYVLGQRDERLEVVGRTANLAPGERIYSTRFVGDRGFVVTFRQVDPLFTLDMSDPSQPTVVGELKIPGFSTYLHVLDEDHLFAVGNDFDVDGIRRNGVALSIFDVSNLATPRLVHKALVGSTRGYSEALYEHKAFTMFRPSGDGLAVLAIPFTDWEPSNDPHLFWRSFRSSLKVFSVSFRGVLGLGELDHSGLYERNQTHDWAWWYRPNIRRGVFIDRYVYAVSDAGLSVASLDDLDGAVVEVPTPLFQP